VLEETIKKLNAELITASNTMKAKLEEIEELKETLEIHSESVEMVEKLTEKIETFEE
jgi:ABC-type enterochelin transport system substrate-binding protein